MSLFFSFIAPVLCHPFLQRAIILCLLSSILCALMGSVLMSGRTAFLGDALSHGMLPGITLGMKINGPWWTISLMGAVSGIFLTAITLWTSRHKALDMNSSIAGIYLLAIAISMFFGGSDDLMHAFFGSIFIVPESYVYVLTGCTVGSALFCHYFWNDLKAHSFDAEFSYRAYPKMRWIYKGWLALFVLNVAVQFQGMGSLVILGLTVLPFLSFYVSGTHLKHIFWKSALWNLCATLFSLFLSCYKDLPYGPTLLIILGAGYASALIYSRIKLPYLWRLLLVCSFSCYAQIQRPYIITSSFLLKHITEKLLPKNYKIEVISGNTQKNHTHLHHFPCNARAIKNISNASLIILHGKGIDIQWLPILKSLKTNAKILILSEKITPKKKFDKSRKNFYDELFSDGHVWHDPYYVIQYVKIISKTVFELYPEDTTKHYACAYINTLNKLDTWIATQWEKRKTASGLVFHNSMPHYQNRYGVKLYALSESREAQGKCLMGLKKLNICAIFPEHSHNYEGARQLAQDLKVKLADPLCIDDLPFGESYVSIMKYNTKILCTALTQGTQKKIKTTYKK
ncbi:chelated iron transport system membrane protein YfeD [Holospora obtusa F1]|uniref:Chelated iron transport system membrane protein YfeD n=1 Tax=Holospora obtusa F1 TaxID=1399147 RepID=W6TTG7_HOLOB|nr:zinc ABC transporter substrate-binding protein [Holospora obtusa]ETZ07087.1 chelated iron transport system membrane protein YfeD [Holospora obtusa F1]